MKTLKKISFGLWLFLCGGAIYSLIEILWRGWTHPSMFIVGGLGFVFLYNISMTLGIKSRLIRCALGAFCITLLELGSGIIINIFLGMRVWDYSARPFNFLGQICLLYCFLWFLLSFAFDEIFSYIKKKRIDFRHSL
ncbi:MAG: hypothetical protein ACI3XX_05385 [Eubacteriales bacterium]